MNWRFLAVKLLQLVIVAIILTLFLVPQQLKPPKFSKHQTKLSPTVCPGSVFCKLQLKPSNGPTVNDTVLTTDFLGLTYGRRPSGELLSVAKCLLEEKSPAECFCLNQFYTVAINVLMSATLALFTLLAFVIACVMSSKKMSRAHAMCSLVTALVVVLGSVAVGLYDAYFFTSGWPFYYLYYEMKENYFQPPINWTIGSSLWLCVALTFVVESMLHVMRLCEPKSSKREKSNSKSSEKKNVEASPSNMKASTSPKERPRAEIADGGFASTAISQSKCPDTATSAPMKKRAEAVDNAFASTAISRSKCLDSRATAPMKKFADSSSVSPKKIPQSVLDGKIVRTKGSSSSTDSTGSVYLNGKKPTEKTPIRLVPDHLRDHHHRP